MCLFCGLRGREGKSADEKREILPLFLAFCAFQPIFLPHLHLQHRLTHTKKSQKFAGVSTIFFLMWTRGTSNGEFTTYLVVCLFVCFCLLNMLKSFINRTWTKHIISEMLFYIVLLNPWQYNDHSSSWTELVESIGQAHSLFQKRKKSSFKGHTSLR